MTSTPTVLRDDEFSRALVIVAHPDDAEFWCGGTVARWSAAGVEITYCVLTDGEAGGSDPNTPRDEIPAIRQGEQRAAAALLGVADVVFLGRAEGALSESTVEVRAELVHVIREVRPQRVVTWSPEWNWARFRSCHPDHLATGALALQAIYPDAGNRFAPMPPATRKLEPWTVRETWLINSPEREVNHYVDITQTFDQKVAAVRAHESQVGIRPHLAEELRGRISSHAAAAGLPNGRLAEAFQVVVTG